MQRNRHRHYHIIKTLLRWCHVTLLIVVVGCTTTPAPQSASQVELLLSPKSLGKEISLSQIVTGRHKDDVTTMRFEIEINAEHIVVVGLSPLGLTLFTLVYEGGTQITAFKVNGSDRNFDPRFILFDIYLTYWPTDTLRRALEARGLSMQDNSGDGTRTVYDEHGLKIAKVIYSARSRIQDDTIIEHYDFPYTLNIRSVHMDTAQ